MPTDTVRVSIAWLPAEPQFSSVIKASKAITNLYENRNIIDEKRFPPHASVHICTLPAHSVDLVAERIRSSAGGGATLCPVLKPIRVVSGSGGYVSVELERSKEVLSVHEAVLEAVAQVRAGMDEEEPYWLRQASEADRTNFAKYGNTYVLDKFDLHFSVAKVDQRDQQAAKSVAEDKLGDMPAVAAASLQICDIGPRSERWEVLTEV